MSSVDVRSFAANHNPLLLGPMPPARLDADMRHLLDSLTQLDPKPIETCGVNEARAQPNLAVVLNRILRDPYDDPAISMELRLIPGPVGDMRARIYTPTDAEGGGRTPMLLYIHGGGWVVGDPEQYDASARALAKRSGAIVVSAHYRQAPEFKFPAAYEDAEAAWQWMLDNAATLGGDATNVAIAGECSGGNIAVNLALKARDEGWQRPRHLLLISPMASTDFTLPSYAESAETRPISAATVRWFYKKLVRNKAELADPRLNLIERSDLRALPPTTIILAETDPLRSEGELLAAALRRSGVWVDCTVYEGVTHQFFGLGSVVNKAMFAQSQAARTLIEAFSAP